MEMTKIVVPDTPLLLRAQVTWADRHRLRDYAQVGQKLFIQRFLIYSAAIALTGFFYDWNTALFYLVAVGLCEVFDFTVFRRILNRKALTPRMFRRDMVRVYAGTFFSALTISMFCVSIARLQGLGGGHFFPLFMLVSASIFAAMNNHHFLPVLAFRLIIYVAAILYIPIRDVVIVNPPLASEMWMSLFTVLFVLGFIVELARNFLTSYSEQLASRIELENEHKRALLAVDAKTRFLATVSHELRTPLTSIKGALDMINSGVVGEAPARMQRLLEMAGRNSDRLGDLVGDLLFLQSSDSGHLVLNTERLDLGQLAQDAVEQTLPYAQRVGVTIHVDATPNAHWIDGDKKRIEQVLLNLLSNAAKFSNAGGDVRVSIDTHEDQVRLNVKDDGIGIPKGTEVQVFEEFFQIDSQDDRQFEGSGLGLSISKRIVEAHGGQITYESELGVGTTFTVTFAAADPAQ